jgi:hypothetical protein
MENLPLTPSDEPEQSPPRQVKTKIEGAEEGKQSAAEQAAATFEDLQSNVKEIAEGAAGYGRRALTEQKEKLADTVQQYSQTAKAASNNLQQESYDALAQRAEEISTSLDRVSNYLRDKELSEIYYDAEHFTRRRPELVFGMMFAAGLLAARFLKASNRDPERGYSSTDDSDRLC